MSDSKSLVVRQSATTQEIVDKALGRDREPEAAVADATAALPTELRRIRRGKFFLSDYEQEQFGSISRPIFEHYCHKVIVGETQPDTIREGIWCFAYHPDFELIPEFQPPSSWPEYVRTQTGWIRADNHQAHIDTLLQRITDIKRLRHEGENK